MLRRAPISVAHWKIPGQHPVGERLGDDRRAVGPAGQPLGDRQVGRLHGRRDPVDHGGNKGNFGRDPAGQLGIDEIGEVQHGVSSRFAVARKVVAADDRDRRAAIS